MPASDSALPDLSLVAPWYALGVPVRDPFRSLLSQGKEAKNSFVKKVPTLPRGRFCRRSVSIDFYFLPQALAKRIRWFVQKVNALSWVYHAASWPVSQARNFRKTGSYKVRCGAFYCTLIVEVYAQDCKGRFRESRLISTFYHFYARYTSLIYKYRSSKD
jgi:hypothetical protein